VDTEVSPEINDIYVSITENDSIISDPYERYIPSLKLEDPVTLKFELIKDVESVVVSMRYEEQEEKRNIHLKKVEPRITVVKAIKYYDANDKRKLQVTLRNSAVDAKAEKVFGWEGAEAESVAADGNSFTSFEDRPGEILSTHSEEACGSGADIQAPGDKPLRTVHL